MPQILGKAASYAVLPVWTLILAALVFGRDKQRPIVSLESFFTLLALGVVLSVTWLCDNSVKRAYRAGTLHASQYNGAYLEGLRDGFSGDAIAQNSRPAAGVTPIGQRKHV